MNDTANLVQGTEACLQSRLGWLSASRLGLALAKTKSGYSASRANLMADLIVERLTGARMETYQNAAMQWGIDKEPEAKDCYSLATGYDVSPVGFVKHPTIAYSGASPDGLVLDDGLIEVKCPNSATHLDTLLGASIDLKYRYQMQWQMACTNRLWCDFVSYDPRVPAKMRMHVQRVPRSEALIEELTAGVIDFLSEMDLKMKQLAEKFA